MMPASPCRAPTYRWLAPPPRRRMMWGMSEPDGVRPEDGLEADLRAVAERRDREAFGRLFAF